MACERHKMGNTTTIVCGTRRRLPTCKICNQRPGTQLCDFELKGTKAGMTCDMPLCKQCAQQQPDGKEFCPPHHNLAEKLAKETQG